MKEACEQNPITIGPDSPDTITKEFKLYCDDAWKKGLLGTTLYTCATIFTLLMGIVANNYGRKLACVWSLILGSLGAIFIGFSPNYWIALAMYGLAGF
jgi:MFS family permease